MRDGIKINLGMKTMIYREAWDIKLKDGILEFKTNVICVGNSTDQGGKRCFRTMSDSTVSGIEHLVSNPIIIRYESIGERTTGVKVYLNQAEGFEVISR